MDLTVTVGMEEHQIRQLVMLVVTIPVMSGEVLLALDHLDDPSPGVIRVASFGPSIEPPPDRIVELGNRRLYAPLAGGLAPPSMTACTAHTPQLTGRERRERSGETRQAQRA